MPLLSHSLDLRDLRFGRSFKIFVLCFRDPSFHEKGRILQKGLVSGADRCLHATHAERFWLQTPRPVVDMEPLRSSPQLFICGSRSLLHIARAGRACVSMRKLFQIRSCAGTVEFWLSSHSDGCFLEGCSGSLGQSSRASHSCPGPGHHLPRNKGRKCS